MIFTRQRAAIGNAATQAVALLLALTPSTSFSQTQFHPNASDQMIAEIIVKNSRAQYYARGKPCACPDDRMRNGRRCGGNSAYSRPGGASPKCYISDVSSREITSYKARLK